MDLDAFYDGEFEQHADVVAKTRIACREPFERLVGLSVESLQAGGKLLFFGNGGSAADSQHLATELSCRYVKDRDAIAALALTTDTSVLTAAGNDYGFEHVFSRQIEAIGKPGDVAIGISTSGNSENVILALRRAHERGLIAAGFGGRDGGKMKKVADPFLVVPSKVTARIQEMHITLGQMLCGAIEQELGLV